MRARRQGFAESPPDDALRRNESGEPDLETGNHDNMSRDLAFEAAFHRSMSSAPITLSRESTSLCRSLASV
jgi:hypothetical protein